MYKENVHWGEFYLMLCVYTFGNLWLLLFLVLTCGQAMFFTYLVVTFLLRLDGNSLMSSFLCPGILPGNKMPFSSA